MTALPNDYETWLTGSLEEAAALLRPYPSEEMRIVLHGVGENAMTLDFDVRQIGAAL